MHCHAYEKWNPIRMHYMQRHVIYSRKCIFNMCVRANWLEIRGEKRNSLNEKPVHDCKRRTVCVFVEAASTLQTRGNRKRMRWPPHVNSESGFDNFVFFYFSVDSASANVPPHARKRTNARKTLYRRRSHYCCCCCLFFYSCFRLFLCNDNNIFLRWFPV